MSTNVLDSVDETQHLDICNKTNPSIMSNKNLNNSEYLPQTTISTSEVAIDPSSLGNKAFRSELLAPKKRPTIAQQAQLRELGSEAQKLPQKK